MKFFIDGVKPILEPRAIDVIPPESSEHQVAGGQRVYIENQRGVDVEVIFGSGGMTSEGLRQLELMRGSQGIHMITFEDIYCQEMIDLLVNMPRTDRTFKGVGNSGYVYGESTVRFNQINPTFQLVQFTWYLFESAGYSIGNGKYGITMPAAGRFIEEGLSGYWIQVGAYGTAGQEIKVQLRNATQLKDYLLTRGDFEVDSGTGLLENAVYSLDKDFSKSDIINLDIDAVTSGVPAAGSLIAVVQAFAEVYGG